MVRSHVHFAVAFLVLAVLTWVASAGRADDQVTSLRPIPETGPTEAKGASTNVSSDPKNMPTHPAPSSVVNKIAHPPGAAGGIPVQEAPDDGPPGAVYEEPHWLERFNPFHALDPSRPVTVDELCKRLDCVADKLRNEGLVVIKQPDVFSQARLTRFRYDFDQQLSSDLGNFHLVLAARINRLDAATTTQTTALSAALAAPGTTAVKVPELPDLSKINASATSLFGSTIDMSKGPFGTLGLAPSTLAQSGAASAAMGLGVDPTVYLDEKKRFIEHLNHIRRLNLGPDQNDSSGYGLYLLRLPVSITPGECTSQGYGAEVAVKVEHEFTPDFLPSTFRNLVINDIVDRLAPSIYEAIRSGFYEDRLKTFHDAERRRKFLQQRNERDLGRLKPGKTLKTYLIGSFVGSQKAAKSLEKCPQKEEFKRFRLDAIKQYEDYSGELDKLNDKLKFRKEERTLPPRHEEYKLPPQQASIKESVSNFIESFGKKAESDEAIEKFIAALGAWIFRPVVLLTGDTTNDRILLDRFFERLAAVADTSEQAFGSNEERFRDLIKRVRERALFAEEEDANDWSRGSSPATIEQLRKDTERVLYALAYKMLESLEKKDLCVVFEEVLSEKGDKAARDEKLIQFFVGRLYQTALPGDDVKFLNTIVGVKPGSEAETSASQIAQNNEAIQNLLRSQTIALNLNLPSVRSAKQLYPIAPRELMDFFLPENFYLLAQDALSASRPKEVRAQDVRNYLRATLDPAYTALSRSTAKMDQAGEQPLLDDDEFIRRVLEAISQREFRADATERPQSLDDLYKEMTDRLERGRKNIKGRAMAALCWAIVVDAALLDRSLGRDARKVFDANGVPCEPLDEAHFYHTRDYYRNNPGDPAIGVFNEYVKRRWPIVVFALDPVTDQQNIADSFNLKRDLQLALSFAFATGQIGFNQLSTFRRQIEQSADTIALNRTVTGFVHGSDVFGYRFTPRFQNPPAQRTNLGVIASQLISGGPGPDYQIKKSKLEPGIRELTAIVLLPTFLPVMRMNVTGNWFKLNDPEHLIYHTRRQMGDGRRVQQVRQAVLCDPRLHEYRADDLRVLHAKLDMLDAMLPTQSKVIPLPFENSASGFDLFSEGATALVPELTGFSGVDVIQPPPASAAAATPTTPVAGSPGLQVSTTTTGTATFTTTSIVGGTGSIADLFVFGKYISLLDTKVIAGGRSAAFEILSREVIHVQVPANAIATTTEDGKTYIEIYLATPNGASNSLLVPYRAAADQPKVAFDLKSDSQSEDVYYHWDGQSLVATDDPGKKKTINISWDSPTSIAPRTLQVHFSGTINAQPVTFDLTADQGASGDYKVSLQQFTVKLLETIQSSTTPQASVGSPTTFTVSVQPSVPNEAQGFRVSSKMKQLKSKLTVNMFYKAPAKNALPEPPKNPAASNSTSMRSPKIRSGQAPIAAARRAQDTSVVKAAQTLPTPPASLSAPQPPAQLTPPVLLSPGVTNEAEQVARMLTGRPFDPNTASSPPPQPPGTVLAPGAATTPAQTAITATPTASGSQPIVVLPAPVVVVPPKPDVKKHHKMHYRPGQLMRNLGNHIEKALPSLPGGG